MSKLGYAARMLHTWRRFLFAMVVLLLTPLLFLGFHVCRYHSVTPQPTRNYAAEYNEPTLNVLPKQARAWTHYRAILRDTSLYGKF